MSRRMSQKGFLQALMNLLQSPEVQTKAGKLAKHHGLTFYDRDKDTQVLKNIKITIDPRNSPVVTIVIHELLHVYFAKYHSIDKSFTDPIEEAIVESVSIQLTTYLHKHPRLFQTWVEAVADKLDG